MIKDVQGAAKFTFLLVMTAETSSSRHSLETSQVPQVIYPPGPERVTGLEG